MGPGGRGRSLTALFIGVLRQALAEMDASPVGEETPLLVLLALFEELALADTGLLEALPRSPVDRHLHAAALLGMWGAARTGLARAWREAGQSAAEPLWVKLEAALSPGALLSGRVPALGGTTLYGCDLAPALARAEALSANLAREDAGAVLRDLDAGLAADDELSRRCEEAAAVGRIRGALREVVVAAEAAGRGARALELRVLNATPGALGLASRTSACGADLLARIEGLGTLLGAPGTSVELLRRGLAAWAGQGGPAAVGLGRSAARSEYARALLAFAADLALEALLTPARRALSPRSGSEVEGGIEAEWEAGRLYRISAAPGPILQTTVQRPLGHLFADVKDFTRRTGLLGPAAMAEFLRTEFYQPILVAAKSFFTGMRHLADRGGIAVNNLLGDAISVSGDVEALLELAIADPEAAGRLWSASGPRARLKGGDPADCRHRGALRRGNRPQRGGGPGRAGRREPRRRRAPRRRGGGAP